RHLLENVELPMWRQTNDGLVTWSNAAFQRLAEAVDDPSKSLQRQFDPAADKRRVQRAEVHVPNEAEARWYEFRVADLDGDMLITAIPVDRVVRAEKSLGAFVQTLTQTFAHLNVGLAVFSRTRELAVFNPALTELLDLSPEFLVTRPSLHHMFERMREQRMVPEPKNNTSWRQRMADIEAAASDTELSETWSLVDGRTLRVTGRPHPEGAIALLFEDISNEISLERRFRAELQLGHAVIDGLDEALAVFSPSGALVISNRAYNRLWHNGLMAKDAAPNFIEATRIWQHHCHPTPVWGDARDFVATIGERTNWTADVHMASGKSLACRFDTLTGGFTLAGFTERATRAHARPAARLSA
ncbi:MAG: PAS-domain containing protein, partial [Pseudomonadota bacterium]